jgi:hypothetical protein
VLNGYKKLIIPAVNSLGRRKERRRFPGAPVVIGGAGRSGTTLLLSILDAHPRLYCFPEQIGMFREWDRVEGPDGAPREVPRRIDRLYRWLLTHRIPRQAVRWCEKTPHNVRYFRQILEYYHEQVRLIHLIRDGRDVVTSRHPYKPDRYWVPVSRWVNDVSAGLAFHDHPCVLTIRYEDLITEYGTTIEAVCAHIGEECTESVRDWFAHTGIRSSRHWFEPVQQLHTKAIGRWKQPEHAARVAELMQDERAALLLEELGYTGGGTR